MQRVLVSACLMGCRVRFDGRAKTVGDAVVDRWRAEGRLVVHCPEVAGGLPVPRPPAEIEEARGADAVLRGEARLRTPEGDDVTRFYLAGARAALASARSHGVRVAVLKESSPSCGPHRVHDGGFTGTTTDGPGVTARLLLDHGVSVYNENEIEEANVHLETLEGRR
ncbi:DUF523 domain-containing protein [Halostreptopolyspora alba]|uniref:DUF523 domain-containing protein n=1 Tax=Halostreptopolyspora alba TaxID=2487137 RepID=A0A3N0EFA0_9ACTN|nr:DUF523 domain-containing protein [Nocardiopsaceae bacterium YIM 96095]